MVICAAPGFGFGLKLAVYEKGEVTCLSELSRSVYRMIDRSFLPARYNIPCWLNVSWTSSHWVYLLVAAFIISRTKDIRPLRLLETASSYISANYPEIY